MDPKAAPDVQSFLLSQSVPQLIRHVSLLNRVTQEQETKMYVKIGTTGTGGMGLNIPYTHSEERPSKKLLAKTEAGFGHTGLLFLMARTPNSPIVKEVKPAAMIGYRKVSVRSTKDRYDNTNVFRAKTLPLDSTELLELRADEKDYDVLSELRMSLIDTGENGVFTKGEFAAITSLHSMEFITPEEIAQHVCREIHGATSGHDVISALDSAVLDPTYKAGVLRRTALHDLEVCETELLDNKECVGLPSIALGRVGPAELSKFLFEASLLKHVFKTFEGITNSELSDAQVGAMLVEAMPELSVDSVAPSIGVPVLLPDGKTLLRGPRINVPELLGHLTHTTITPEAVDAWARKGWVDLRDDNISCWRKRCSVMAQSRVDMREGGSARATISAYLHENFEVGDAVGWIVNNELHGNRTQK